MIDNELLTDFRRKVCREIDLESEGVDRYIVHTPFMFDDGDHFVVLLRKNGSGWFITDEGHTFMHLSYSGTDISKGSRAKIVEESLATHRVENRNGELRITVPRADFGDALYSYLQALSMISTVPQMTQERVASTFVEDFAGLLYEVIPEQHAELEWHDPQHDPQGDYAVDCRINQSSRPCFVFGVNSDAKCSHATISCLMFERWGIVFRSVVLFEDQTKIARRPLAQLSNVVDKQFSSLGERDRIGEYFKEEILADG